MLQYADEKLKISHSPIASMELPSGWFEDFEDRGANGSYSRRFHHLNFPTAEIFTYQSGRPVDTDSIKAFKELLSASPKVVLPVVLEKIKGVIGVMSYPQSFKILIAYTQAVAGRNVLVVEGRWANDQDVYALFMPEEQAESRYVVELHYEALKEDFRKNLQEFKKTVSTIKWQDK